MYEEAVRVRIRMLSVLERTSMLLDSQYRWNRVLQMSVGSLCVAVHPDRGKVCGHVVAGGALAPMNCINK